MCFIFTEINIPRNRYTLSLVLTLRWFGSRQCDDLYMKMTESENDITKWSKRLFTYSAHSGGIPIVLLVYKHNYILMFLLYWVCTMVCDVCFPFQIHVARARVAVSCKIDWTKNFLVSRPTASRSRATYISTSENNLVPRVN